MMWLARLKPLVAVAAALTLTTAGVAVLGRQRPAADRGGVREQAKPLFRKPPRAAPLAAPDQATNQALARQQLVLINNALEMLHRFALNARIELGNPAFAIWERRKLEAFVRREPGRPK